ncbi:hypothetical protein [Grimontia sp. AD028]|uniref:hypothetical protein n=1 Tax=Grimontia sp. AD028 TaxID=1581149 RepID=UPI000A7FFD8B|nr:hypothetical protein [Grimontia sp. AD028]
MEKIELILVIVVLLMAGCNKQNALDPLSEHHEGYEMNIPVSPIHLSGYDVSL